MNSKKQLSDRLKKLERILEEQKKKKSAYFTSSNIALLNNEIAILKRKIYEKT